MKRIAAVGVLLLSGCATTIPLGPNGQPMHHIQGFGATNAYEKAAELCPAGYNVLQSYKQGWSYMLDIECV